mmetsp:Transcript_22703/g.51356  ORF Transcript_22703/g.51356 Transcript_22703/m.51356 type:complete len:270 (+) Transcript_22703:1842-2651(+)
MPLRYLSRDNTASAVTTAPRPEAALLALPSAPSPPANFAGPGTASVGRHPAEPVAAGLLLEGRVPSSPMHTRAALSSRISSCTTFSAWLSSSSTSESLIPSCSGAPAMLGWKSSSSWISARQTIDRNAADVRAAASSDARRGRQLSMGASCIQSSRKTVLDNGSPLYHPCSPHSSSSSTPTRSSCDGDSGGGTSDAWAVSRCVATCMPESICGSMISSADIDSCRSYRSPYMRSPIIMASAAPSMSDSTSSQVAILPSNSSSRSPHMEQ